MSIKTVAAAFVPFLPAGPCTIALAWGVAPRLLVVELPWIDAARFELHARR
jgi:hypothetical protein